MKALKIVVGIVFILVLLLVAIAAAVAALFDPNDHRADIEQQVQEQTGRQFRIDGDLKLSVFPWLAVELPQLKLANAKGFGDKPFASMQSAQAGVKILPLLSSQIELGELSLQGLQLNLVKKADGSNNWDDLAQASEEPEQPEAPKSEEQGALEIGDLRIAGLVIADAAISYTDEGTKQQWRLSEFDLESGAVQLGEPVDVKLSTKVEGNQPKLTTMVRLQGTLAAPADFASVAVKAAELSLDTDSAELGWKGNTSLKGDISFDLQTQKLQAPKSRLSVNGTVSQAEKSLQINASLHGDFDGDFGVQQLQFQNMILDYEVAGQGSSMNAAGQLKGQLLANLVSQVFEFKDNQLTMVAQGIEVPGESLDAAISSQLKVDLSKQVMSLTNATAKVNGAELKANITGSQILDAPSFAGDVELPTVALKDWLQRLDIALPKTQDAKAFSAASIKANFQTTATSFKLSGLQAKLDDSTLTGAVDVSRFQPLRAVFNLKIDQLNADRYMAPVQEGAAQQPADKAPAGEEAELFPVDLLREIQVDGQFKVGALVANNLKSRNVSVKLKAKDGDIRISPTSAQMYGGQYTGAIRLDVRGRQPVIRMNEVLSGVQAGPLLTDLTGEAQVTGTMRAKLQLTARGNTATALRNSLQGPASFDFKDGYVKQMDMLLDLRRAWLTFNGKGADGVPGSGRTDFQKLSGSFNFEDGVGHSNDLKIHTNLMTADGTGKIDLPNEKLKFKTILVIHGTGTGDGDKWLGKLKGKEIPLRIKGSFADIGTTPDLEGLLKAEAERRVKEKVQEKLQERFGEEVGGELQKGLEGLFGR